MTGPEHYREAETLIELAARSGDHPANAAEYLAAAQVHATLALAAAAATASADRDRWYEVILP